MKLINTKLMKVYPYEEREKNILHQSKNFKIRMIELLPGKAMPPCTMKSSVVFYVIKGKTEIIVNDESETLQEGSCLIIEPSTISLKSSEGVKILAIQIDL